MIAKCWIEVDATCDKAVRLTQKALPILAPPRKKVTHHCIASKDDSIDAAIVSENIVHNLSMHSLTSVVAQAERTRPRITIGHNRQARSGSTCDGRVLGASVWIVTARRKGKS